MYVSRYITQTTTVHSSNSTCGEYSSDRSIGPDSGLLKNRGLFLTDEN